MPPRTCCYRWPSEAACGRSYAWVFRWREIARITVDQFDGDLNPLLKLSYKEAKKGLKQFPNIGDPQAEKILLYCGVAGDLPLESNGLRVLTRFGFGREEKSYGATYKSVQEAIVADLPCGSAALAQAHHCYASTARRCVNETIQIAARALWPMPAPSI